jgi:hypothetical protein
MVDWWLAPTLRNSRYFECGVPPRPRQDPRQLRAKLQRSAVPGCPLAYSRECSRARSHFHGPLALFGFFADKAPPRDPALAVRDPPDQRDRGSDEEDSGPDDHQEPAHDEQHEPDEQGHHPEHLLGGVRREREPAGRGRLLHGEGLGVGHGSILSEWCAADSGAGTTMGRVLGPLTRRLRRRRLEP